MSTVADCLTAIGHKLGETIDSSSDPTQSAVIQWINESCRWLVGFCAQQGSDIGRTTGTITLADGTSSYNDINTIFCPAQMYDENGKPFNGWLQKTYERVPLTLCEESKLLEYDPSSSGENEPVEFYIDASGNFYPLPVPDTTYTAKIPYYPKHTTLTATTDTMPFGGIFDDIINEAAAIRANNRDEYDLGYDLKWLSFLKGEATKMIQMRKGLAYGVGL